MSVLTIRNLEKQDKDLLLFPAFDLEVAEGQVVGVHSNLNIRMTILEMFLGKEPIFKGEIAVLGQKITNDKKLYDQSVGICFFEEGLYPR